MKLWLILAGVAAGVSLMFGALRAKPPVASNQTSQRFSEVQPLSETDLAGSSGLSRANDFSHGAGGSDESDVAAKAALLEGMPASDQQYDLAGELLTKLFENDPASATKFVTALHEPLKIQMAAALASLWGEKDVRSAAEWAMNLPPSAVRTHALLSLCADWATVDPKNAAAFVIASFDADFPIASATATVSSPTNDVRSQMLFIIGSRWGVENSSDALKSVNQLPDGPDRDSFIAGIASTLGESSPSDAAVLVASMAPGRQQNDAALTVLLEWGRSDPQAAVDWLKLFPAGEFRDKAIQSLSAILAERESDLAKAILLDWSETAERTRAVRSYLNETLDTDASRGANVLAGLEGNVLFQEETERVAQHWLMQEPSAALQWLAETDLDDSTRMRLLSAPGLAIPSPQ